MGFVEVSKLYLSHHLQHKLLFLNIENKTDIIPIAPPQRIIRTGLAIDIRA